MQIQVQPKRSSFISNIGYDDLTHELSVEMNKKIYVYKDVKKETAAAFVFAESKGSFFSTKIKNHYETLLRIPLKEKKGK